MPKCGCGRPAEYRINNDKLPIGKSKCYMCENCLQELLNSSQAYHITGTRLDDPSNVTGYTRNTQGAK